MLIRQITLHNIHYHEEKKLGIKYRRETDRYFTVMQRHTSTLTLFLTII